MVENNNRPFQIHFIKQFFLHSQMTGERMTFSAVLPCLVFFLVLFPFGASYSIDVDTGLTSSSKITYLGSDPSFGGTVDTNQDFNGDGFNDILVSDSGIRKAFLIFGGSTVPALPSVTFSGPSTGSFSGSCGFAGDVNKDGYADIIIGAKFANISSSSGEAYLILGGPSTPSAYSVMSVNARTITYKPEKFEYNGFGHSVSGVGDVNKDGFDDFVICDYSLPVGGLSQTGACYLIYGGTNLQSISMANLGSGGIKMSGSIMNQQLGSRVSRAGDINKDGYADFLVSNGNEKNIYLFYGGASLVSFTTASFSGVTFPNPSTGNSDSYYPISAAGDFNHDGFDDVMMSSLRFSTSCVIYVVYGGNSLPSTVDLNTFASTAGVRYYTNARDSGGLSLSGGVDYNLDGIDDIIIGVPRGRGDLGSAHVVFGSASPVDSSVFTLGDGVLSLNASLRSFYKFGQVVALTEGVAGPNTRGILVATAPGMDPSTMYYLHDLLGTPSPSVSPTNGPTTLPTFTPSASPSVVPSFRPTVVPSADPTANPTFVPSVTPSKVPTPVPSIVPTFVPSGTPTIVPTWAPSSAPTFGPTRVPTVGPTFVPSVTPTVEPTRSPSVVPTDSPTVTPTQTPTLAPSVDPTMFPTEVPTMTPSFRPSAPTYSPSAVPTATPTARTKGSIIVKTDLTVNSVNGATLSPTSQETIKQSIANASQTTPNNVDLVSMTRTNRRLLSSVVHRMLAAVPLFSYKVVAEIHFNLIDFPGLNESYVAGTKSKGLIESVKTHEFDRIISYYAAVNNATQLLNLTTTDIIVTTTVVPVPGTSASEDALSDGQIAGLVIGIILGTLLLLFIIYCGLAKKRLLLGRSNSGKLSSRKVAVVALDVNSPVDLVKVSEE
jgi:hypothetical protein